MKNRLLEISLIEIIILIGLHLLNLKVGVFIGLLTGILSGAIFLITQILEWIEPSKIGRPYFYFMILTSIISFSTSMIFIQYLGWPFST